ncbi:MAG: GNAT family N-acetyltransferase [Pseudomonadota bacterium]
MDRKDADIDVRQELTHAYHADAQAAAKTTADAPVEIRLARAEDADGLARCFYGAYGDSYDHDWVYKPDALRRRWADRAMVSVVGLAPDGEVIGHLAASFAARISKVAEAGQAVVSPSYRGHHLFESMKQRLAAWAVDDGLYGLFSEATTAHPYSQRGNLALGAHEMGFIFGYIPGAVQYKQMADPAALHRKTAALMYLRTNREPSRTVHPPAAYREIAMRIYGNAEFARTVGAGGISPSDADGQVHLKRDHDHNAALLTCDSVGAGSCAQVAARVETLKAEGLACLFLDLPLADPNLFVYGADLADLGFAFSCILPEVREDGDILRLQYHNEPDLHLGQIATSSDFGRALLAEIAAGYQGDR